MPTDGQKATTDSLSGAGGGLEAQMTGHLPLAQWMMHDGWTGWGWPFGGFFWLLFVGLAIYGLIQLLRSRESIGPKDDASGSTALKTLDERYAKSEIDREEYLRRKRDILGKGET